ncbi:hypothetical protein LWI28_007466 [Acer negundo]|uniref:Uncharacterized protein n=1 Tax=Acer negundo TaxID=4023 RepID=A0AAD5NJ18_ACENE|nr:hypothetical protein LWI28_007466 [Acer negundo]
MHAEQEAMQPGRTKEEGRKQNHEFSRGNTITGTNLSLVKLQFRIRNQHIVVLEAPGSWLQCAEHCRCTFCARLVSAVEFYPSKSSNSSLVVMGIFDFTKVLSAQIPFTLYGFNAPTNNEMLSPRWMNEVASGNVTSLGVSSQSNAAAGEDSNEVEDVGLL